MRLAGATTSRYRRGAGGSRGRGARRLGAREVLAALLALAGCSVLLVPARVGTRLAPSGEAPVEKRAAGAARAPTDAHAVGSPPRPPPLPPPPPQPPPPSPPPPLPRPKYAALGVATLGHTKEASLRTFLLTLRDVQPEVDVFLFVDREPQELRADSRTHFVLFDPSELPNGWRSYHPSSWRYLIYHRFMQGHFAEGRGTDYEVVQACDLRDVAFQRDPFASVTEDAVYVFEEDAKMKIGMCWVNRNWIAACYGGNGVGPLLSTPISCSGYAIGSSGAMAAYFAHMASELGHNRGCEQNGIDQGIHNVLVRAAQTGWRSGRAAQEGLPPLPRFTFQTNERGMVYTGGYAPKGKYSLDAQGRYLNQAGELYAVLHQYDRHEQMLGSLVRVADELQARSDAGLPARSLSTALGVPVRRVLVWLVLHDAPVAQWFTTRKSGEVVVVESLLDELRAIGAEVTVFRSRESALPAIEGAVASGLGGTLVLVDPATVTNFEGRRWWTPSVQRHFRAFEFFGLGRAEALRLGLAPKHVWTTYPSEHNTHIGFPLDVAAAPARKARQGPRALPVVAVWGKERRYFRKECFAFLRELAKEAVLLSTSSDGVPIEISDVVTSSQGLRARTDWLDSLASASLLLGLGDPLLGPSAVEAMSVGTAYLDPVLDPPKELTGVRYVSQHPYAAAQGEPYAYRYSCKDVPGALAAARKAIAGASRLRPHVPPELEPTAYAARVRAVAVAPA